MTTPPTEFTSGSSKPPIAVPLTKLKPSPWNPRTIKDDRFKNLCESLSQDPEFLWRRPVLAQADGTIYAGNMRFRAAERLGLKTIPAIVEDVSPRLARERALRDNAQWGEWESDTLASLLKELEVEGSRLDLLGLSEGSLRDLLDQIGSSERIGEDEVPQPTEDPEVSVGELWLLGRHRLLCADSTDPANLRRLADSTRLDCLWTDPPYGVSYVGGTKKKLSIANDDADALMGLLTAAFSATDEVLLPGAPLYVCHASGPQALVAMKAFIDQGWTLRQSLVWMKDAFVLGHSDYHYQHEPLLFGYKPADIRLGRGKENWFGGNDQCSIFQIPRPRVSEEHPTMKPVALIEAMLRNSTKRGQVVLDPFLGSGTTLIAAERLGRTCFGLEVDPTYASVIKRRWENYTGQTAVLADQASFAMSEAIGVQQ